MATSSVALEALKILMLVSLSLALQIVQYELTSSITLCLVQQHPSELYPFPNNIRQICASHCSDYDFFGLEAGSEVSKPLRQDLICVPFHGVFRHDESNT